MSTYKELKLALIKFWHLSSLYRINQFLRRSILIN